MDKEKLLLKIKSIKNSQRGQHGGIKDILSEIVRELDKLVNPVEIIDCSKLVVLEDLKTPEPKKDISTLIEEAKQRLKKGAKDVLEGDAAKDDEVGS